mmetsp:Transcript_6063/g.11597  ORF Transcript_6063/g.11597 Transcript_6063/m.11597 type:complete len:411 (-) Transcript_6063:96-1328(-)
MESSVTAANIAPAEFELRETGENADEALARQLQLEENSQALGEARTLTPYMQMDLEGGAGIETASSRLQRLQSCILCSASRYVAGLQNVYHHFLATRCGKAVARCCRLHEHLGWRKRSKCVGCGCACTYLWLVPVFYLAGHYIMYPGSYLTMRGYIKYPAPSKGCMEFNFTAEHSSRTVVGYRCTYVCENDLWYPAELKHNATRSAIFFGGNNMMAWHAVNVGVALLPGAANKSSLEILSFSYPGYMPNEGWSRETDILDDAVGLVHYAMQRSQVPPVLLGWSLGTAVTMAVASGFQENEISCVVLGNPFTSMWAMVGAVTAGLGIPWVWLFDRWPTATRAESVKAPTLVLSGLKDELIPSWQHKEVFERVPGNKKKLIEMSSNHNQVMPFVNHKYDDIKNFFTQWCPTF